MRRKALIIGNSGDLTNPDEYLEGVAKDIENFKNFLLSNHGGKWNNEEIIISLDEPKKIIEQKINILKRERNDFVFVIFSGHGSYSDFKKCRKLYILDDFIYEDDLTYLATKQITILDTCAHIEDDLLKESFESKTLNRAFMHYAMDYRRIYEHEIIKCLPQQVVLYSSSINEGSGDDSELGGYFSYTILEVAKKNSKSILSSKEAYFATKNIVKAQTHNRQNPQFNSSSRTAPYLPFSLGVR